MDTIKQFKTLPYLNFAFVDNNNAPINCTPFEVTIVVFNRKGQTIIEELVTEGAAAEWVDQTLGTGIYKWKDNDTRIAGRYRYRFDFKRLSDGKEFSVPKDTFYEFIVAPSKQLIGGDYRTKVNSCYL